jgi:hypothetical protein
LAPGQVALAAWLTAPGLKKTASGRPADRALERPPDEAVATAAPRGLREHGLP